MNEEPWIHHDETDALDRALTNLFAEVRPSAALEERAVRGLQAGVRRQRAFAGWQRKVVVGLAASVGLGLCGAAISTLPGLPFPGSEEAKGQLEPKENAFEQHNGQVRDVKFANGDKHANWQEAKDLSNPDIGLDSNLKAAVESNRQEDVNVDSKIVNREPLGVNRYYYERGKQNNGETDYKTNGTQQLNFGPPIPLIQSKDGEASRATSNDTSFALSAPPIGGFINGGGAFGGGGFGGVGGNPATFRPAMSQVPGLVAKEIEKNKEQYEAKARRFVENTNALAPPAADQQAVARKVIRSGDIEFEVESFDSAVAAATLLVNNIKGGFVATVNSDKLPNGKVKGAIVVRVPPESLDGLVLDLRKELGKAGELKGQKIGSQDITKQYTDLESRLKAARAMEGRLLKMIEEGKGEIKQLLEAEKELGVWRTRIEETEGELRYYANLVGLATLSISLTEREIRTAAAITACEHIDTAVEVEDVTVAYRDLMKAVLEAKGRVLKAELKQTNANQFNATVVFEVAPEAAGPMQDRLRQLGRVARMQIDLVQTADGGPVLKDTKVKRGDTAFSLAIYSVTASPPRESTALQIAAADVPASYRALQDAVAKAKGRVLAANLNEQDRQNVTAKFDFEIRRAEEAGFQAALAGIGEIVSRSVVTRAVETDAVTDAKVLYETTLTNLAKLKPREATTLTVEVPDVDAATSAVTGQVLEAKGRPVEARTARERNGQVTAKLTFAVPLAAAPGLVEKFKQAGVVRVFDTSRDPQAGDGPSATARISLTLTNVNPIVASDDGVMPQVRKGLSWSARVLLWSVTYVIVGACVIVPWALVGYGGYRLIRRLFRRPSAA